MLFRSPSMLGMKAGYSSWVCKGSPIFSLKTKKKGDKKRGEALCKEGLLRACQEGGKQCGPCIMDVLPNCKRTEESLLWVCKC